MNEERKKKHEAAQAAKVAASVNVRRRGHTTFADLEVATSTPVDWSFWRAMRTVKLWQACALVVDIDPDSLKHPQFWVAEDGPLFALDSFPSKEIHSRFDKTLRLAVNAVNTEDGPIFPKSQLHQGDNWEKDVLLNEVVAYFRSLSLDWLDIAAPLQPIAIARQPLDMHQTITSNLPAAAVVVPKQRAQEDRILELLNAQGYSPLALEPRAAGKPGPKAEIRTLAMNERGLFTTKTFDTAWQRLRSDKRISGAE